jgi:hypothetical protein
MLSINPNSSNRGQTSEPNTNDGSIDYLRTRLISIQKGHGRQFFKLIIELAKTLSDNSLENRPDILGESLQGEINTRLINRINNNYTRQKVSEELPLKLSNRTIQRLCDDLTTLRRVGFVPSRECVAKLLHLGIKEVDEIVQSFPRKEYHLF